MGVNLAVYALQIGRLPTWAEMHQVFMQGMPSILGQAARAAAVQGESSISESQWSRHVSTLELHEIAIGKSKGANIVPPPLNEVPSMLIGPK